jgi:DNA-binding transcriptional LysR family regulator
MELRQLEYLVAVVEEASFTRAAERVRVSQSGISAQIRRLERELGHELVDRSGRTMRATDAGAAVLPYARAALAAVSDGRLAVDALAGLVSGQVKIGMITACSIPILFDLVAEFHQAHPGVDISLAEDTSDLLLAHVQDGTFDLALVGVAGELPSTLSSRTVVSESLVAAVASDHPLARRSSVSLQSIVAYPVVTMPVGTGIRTAFDSACSAAGIAPRVAFEASTGAAVSRLAGDGLGVAILTESMVPAGGELMAIPFTGARPGSRIDFVWKPNANRSPATRELISRVMARVPVA